MATAQDFASEYEIALKKAVEKNPEEYLYGVDKVPEVAAKMIAAFKAGHANIGPAMRSAARKCGIKPTLSAVKQLLNQ